MAAAHLVPLGTGRTDIYLYPSLVVLVAVGLDVLVGVLPSLARRIVISVALLAMLVAPFHLKPTMYNQQDVRSLVGELDDRRVVGDAIVIYPPASFAFALYSGLPAKLVPSTDFGFGWTVEFADPAVTVLPHRRWNPTEYEPAIADAVEGHVRVWLVASHMHPNDYPVVRRYLAERGFSMTEQRLLAGARLELWTRSADGDAMPPERE